MTTIELAQSMLDEAAATRWQPSEVSAYWNTRDGSHYGEGMSKWIPHFAQSHTLFIESLQPFHRPYSRILDLGAGNGRVSKLLLDNNQDCHVTLVDLPNGMLKAAPAKLAEYSGRFRIHPADIFNDSLQFDSASYDCVVSVFALCHAPNSSAY